MYGASSQKATSIAGDSVSPSVPSKSKRTPTVDIALRPCRYPGGASGAYSPSVVGDLTKRVPRAAVTEVP